MKCLVTGGAGFIGSHACEALLYKGYDVYCYDNFDSFYDPAIKENNLLKCLEHPQFHLIRGDILNADDLSRIFESNSIDVVIHLAAKAGVRPSIQDPLLYQRVNVEGTMRLFEAMRQNKVRKMIMASSSSVYGNNKKIPYAETDNVDCVISPYAATKKACEVLAYMYYHLYGIETFCLRFFTVYGPRQRPEMAIHQFTRKIYQGRAIQLFGDGTTSRDYTYIDDIVQGVLGCVENLKGYEILNLGESKTITLIDLVKLIESELDRKANIEWLPMQPGDVFMTNADIQKAKNLIQYDPRVDIREGVKYFVQWFLSDNHSSK